METERHASRPEGRVPNSRFPLLIHRAAIPGGEAGTVRDVFRGNGWTNNWEYPGIYDYAHYHSTSHEVLCVARGWMELELSVSGGSRVRLEAGDVVVMPAGVSHAMTGSGDDVLVVGGYPEGRDWDNMRGDRIDDFAAREAAKRIMMLPIPAKDPVTGGLMEDWMDAPSSVDAGLNDFRDGLG